MWLEIRDAAGAGEFVGYAAAEAEAKVAALAVDGKSVARAEEGDEVLLFATQTPFYAESGGQQGDTGTVAASSGARVAVADTVKRAGDMHAHRGTVSGGPISVGDAVRLSVDAPRRAALRRNHSATHLLHAALRRRLGAHVAQKGSLVAPDRLRFDIAHPRPIAEAELAAVEAEVNVEILRNGAVETVLASPKEVVEKGALALFGEKYGDEARVVSMGGGAEGAYSVELCGGTHVARTGDIGLFKIVGESAVAAGVRRVEAVTGEGALAWVGERARALAEAAALLRTAPGEVPGRVAALLDERRKLERALAEARRALAAGEGAAAPAAKTIAGVAFAGRVLDGAPTRELRGVADGMKRAIGSGVVAAASNAGGKGAVVVGVTGDLTGRFDSVALARAAARALGGKGGGGRRDLAQAGGPDGSAAAAAIAAVEAALGEAGN